MARARARSAAGVGDAADEALVDVGESGAVDGVVLDDGVGVDSGGDPVVGDEGTAGRPVTVTNSAGTITNTYGPTSRLTNQHLDGDLLATVSYTP